MIHQIEQRIVESYSGHSDYIRQDMVKEAAALVMRTLTDGEKHCFQIFRSERPYFDPMLGTGTCLRLKIEEIPVHECQVVVFPTMLDHPIETRVRSFKEVLFRVWKYLNGQSLSW